MPDLPRIEPPEVVAAVELYVGDELRSAEKYTNSEPLDESGIWSLHALAAHIYAMGWNGGERAMERKESAIRQRARDAARTEAARTTTEATAPESEK